MAGALTPTVAGDRTTPAATPATLPAARPDADSVYRVLQVVATHPHTWEAAAAGAIAELTRTITDLRVARVVEKDIALSESGEFTYRVKLSVSYRLDRRRVSDDGAVTTVARVLIVANRTAAGPELMAAVNQRLSAGPTEFHVLVPVVLPSASGTVWGDPFVGFVGTLEVDPEDDTDLDFAWAAAQQRLETQLALLHQAGAVATGELRPVDPLRATLAVLERASFDEIIVSTLPAAISRWLHLDLPRRLARQTSLPITHIEQSDA